MCFVQVGRLERFCCCLRGLFCDSSDMHDALWVCVTLLVQDFFIFFFWVTGELSILRQQEAAADARRT